MKDFKKPKYLLFLLTLSIFYFIELSILKVVVYFILCYFMYRLFLKTEEKIPLNKKNEEIFDKETGLYNLRGFYKFFYDTSINKNKYFVLVDFLSLKRINNYYGRELGDEILKLFIIRIRQIFDYESIIARYDNKRVLICFSGYKLNDLDVFAKKIQKELNEPIVFNGQEISVKSSMALLESSFEENDLDETFYKLEIILKKAEKNMSFYEIYNTSFAKKHEEKLKLERELENAINNNEIKAYYQPQIDIEKSELIGFEALIRWESETFGVLSPGKFLEIAEEQGLYKKFFYLTLENVCKDIVELKRHIKYDFKVSINISDIDLKESDNLLKYIKRFLEKYGLEGKYLELELTENFAVKASDKNISFFNNIKELGISLAIDDFGIGYSSFSHLKNFPIDKIKLDREFVHEIAEDSFAEKIVTSVVELCSVLDVELLAEGIETADQLIKLKELGCHKIQGYIFGKAIPCDKVINLLEEGFYQLGIDLLTKELEI